MLPPITDFRCARGVRYTVLPSLHVMHRTNTPAVGYRIPGVYSMLLRSDTFYIQPLPNFRSVLVLGNWQRARLALAWSWDLLMMAAVRMQRFVRRRRLRLRLKGPDPFGLLPLRWFVATPLARSLPDDALLHIGRAFIQMPCGSDCSRA